MKPANREEYKQLIFNIIEDNYDTIFMTDDICRELSRQGYYCKFTQIYPLLHEMVDKKMIKKGNAPILTITSYKTPKIFFDIIPLPKKYSEGLEE